MTSTYTPLGVELMVTGENAGTWGTKTNTNLNLVEQISGGYLGVSIAGGAGTTTLTKSDGATGSAVATRVLQFTGSITGNRIVTLPVLTENFYIIKNATSGAYTVQLKAATGSGATVTWGTTDKGWKIVYFDGVATNTGVYDTGFSTSAGDVTLTGTQTLTNKTLTSPKIGTNILDTNGAELLNLTATASAVNELTLANAASGNSPIISATGETNVGITLTPKGSGAVKLDLLTFPTVTGSADQIMTSNGSGVLSFVDNSGGIAWQSSVVTASTLSAASGNGYWINTTSNACTVTLPGSPAVGDNIVLTDYLRTWGTNAVTFNLNSLKYQGNTTPVPVYDTEGESINIVYSGATQGWIPNTDGSVVFETPQTYSGDFLTIGGGGGSAMVYGGGGGAGGYRNSFNSETSGRGSSSETALALSPGVTYTVTVGAGGIGAQNYSGPAPGNQGITGDNSVISGSGITTITSLGGGGAAANTLSGKTGGCGGGGGSAAAGGSGTAAQGYDGGAGVGSSGNAGGAGGGAGAVGGANPSTSTGGTGGAGLASSITGSAVTRGGGGGGGAPGGGTTGTGGTGGGGNDSAGTANTGGGGGGGDSSVPAGSSSSNGGSGVVILSMPDGNYSGTVAGSPTVATGVSGKTVLTFTGSGSYTG